MADITILVKWVEDYCKWYENLHPPVKAVYTQRDYSDTTSK